MKINRFAAALIASTGLALCLAASAGAAPVQFQFLFSSPFTAAQASGTITFESSLLPNPPADFSLPNAAVLGLNVTVTGAAAGNGSFGLGDFNVIPFDSPSALDFSRELMGQMTVNGPWGTTSPPLSSFCDNEGSGVGSSGTNEKAMVPFVGDFNLLSPNPSVPSGVYPFVLAANGGQGECMVLISMRPLQARPVPTLDAWGLSALIALLALAGMAANGRVRKTLRRA